MNTISSGRLVLDGVPKVQFFIANGRCPEDICAPAVMRALMEYLGENIGCGYFKEKARQWGMGCTYGYFMGVMGASAAMSWIPGWDRRSFSLNALPGGADESFRRAFAAVGYPVRFVYKEAGEEAYRREIIQSICAGLPVIGSGIVGPADPMLITGFDDGGEVLTGWSFFQNIPPYSKGIEYEECGYFRKRGWFQDAGTLIIAGEPGEQPDNAHVLTQALRRNLEIARATSEGGIFNGEAAYDRWAEELLRGEDFAVDKEDRQIWLMDVYMSAINWVATTRWYGSVWLVNNYRRLGNSLCEPLLKIAACWAGEHDLMWKLWDLMGGIENPAWHLLRQPDIRRESAAIIARSKEKYVESLNYLTRALETVDSLNQGNE